DAVERDGDALRGADRRRDDEQVRARGADVAHELGDDLQRRLVARLARLRQAVPPFELDRAQIAQIAAHARLRRGIVLGAQQLDELSLTLDRMRFEQASNGSPALLLIDSSARHWRVGGVNKLAHIVHTMRKSARAIFARFLAYSRGAAA